MKASYILIGLNNTSRPAPVKGSTGSSGDFGLWDSYPRGSIAFAIGQTSDAYGFGGENG